LSTITQLRVTKFQPKLQGALLLEDADEGNEYEYTNSMMKQ